MGSFNGDFPPWRCSGRQRRRGERRRHPLGNKPWKKELHHQEDPRPTSSNGAYTNIHDPSHGIELDDVQVKENLTYETLPLRIEDRRTKNLRGK